MDDHATRRLETALAAAAAEHRTALRRELLRHTDGFELRFLLARLGVPPTELDTIGAAGTARELPEPLRSAIAARLSLEATRLTRLARAGAPAYDVNRHIGVRRALLWVEAAEARPDAVEEPFRAGGRVLNARFGRHRPPRRPPQLSPGAAPPSPA